MLSGVSCFLFPRSISSTKNGFLVDTWYWSVITCHSRQSVLLNTQMYIFRWINDLSWIVLLKIYDNIILTNQSTTFAEWPTTVLCKWHLLSGGSCLTYWGREKNYLQIAEDVFKCNFVNKIGCKPIRISQKYIPPGPNNNLSAFVLIMSCHRLETKPLS